MASQKTKPSRIETTPAASPAALTTTPSTAGDLNSSQSPPTPSSSPSSLSSSSPLSTTLSSPSSLFPGLQAADLYLADDNDDDNIHDRDLSFFTPHTSLPNLSSTISSLPCVSSSFSSLHNNITCPDDALSKMKIYSSEDLWAENESYARNLAPAMTFIAILMVIGILGNTLVVYVYGIRFKSATQHFLIVSMACFDLIMCLVAMPTEIADMRFHHTFSSLFACKLLRFVTMFASISSSLTLVTVAYDRHRRITRPLSKQMTMRQARIWTVANMVFALCISWPTIVLTGIRASQTGIPGLEGTDCSFSEEYKQTKFPLAYNAVLGLGFFTLIGVIAVFYFRIWKTAKSRKINMAKRYTIGSLSDQSLCELKLKKKLNNKKGMNEILAKQLELYTREKLKTKPSIDCRDMCFFFENNSVRSTVNSSIAKTRGRYKVFSISSSDGSGSRSRSPRNSTSGDSVQGHTFSYRTSINCRARDWPKEDDDTVSRSTRRKSRKLTSGTMENIPEDFSFHNGGLAVHAQRDMSSSPLSTVSTSNSSHLYDDIIQTDDPLDTSPNSSRDLTDMEKYAVELCNSNTDMKQTLVQLTPQNIRLVSNSPLVASPSLSLKSNNSSTYSITNSPGRYRRNSSPLIRPKNNVKVKVDSSISIISDDLHLRPMSSLVESVSQSLARFQEFSDFDISAMDREAVHRDLQPPSVSCMDREGVHRDLQPPSVSCMDREGVHRDLQPPSISCMDREGVHRDLQPPSVSCMDREGVHRDLQPPSISCMDREGVHRDLQPPSISYMDREGVHRDLQPPSISCMDKEGVHRDLQPPSVSCMDDKDNDNIINLFHTQLKRQSPINKINEDLNSDTETDGIVKNISITNDDRFIDNILDGINGESSTKSDVNNSIYRPAGNEKNLLTDEDNTIAIDCTDIALFRSFSHLIGARSKPMDIDYQSHHDDNNRDDDVSQCSPNVSKNVEILLECETSNTNKDSSQLQSNSESCNQSKGEADECVQHRDYYVDTQNNNKAFNSNDTVPSNGTVTSDIVRPSCCETHKETSSSPRISIIETSNKPKNTDCSVQLRSKLRSYSNTSLDAISSTTTTTRRRGKGVGCVCLPRNLDKTTVVAFTVSSVFVLSFLPFLTLMSIRGFVKDFDYSLGGTTLCVYHIFLRFYFLNSAINPFLYGLFNVNFRYECVRTWRKFVRCHGEDKPREKQDTVVIC